MRCEISDTKHIDPSLRKAWQSLRVGNPELASPYFAPEFYEAIASVTHSARLMIVEPSAGTKAFLPLQRRGAGIYGPIGGPLNDIHGLVGAMPPDCEAADLLEASRVQLISLQHARTGQASLGARFGSTHDFHVLSLAGGYEEYEKRRAPLAKSAFRAMRTRAEKARKQFGSVRLVYDDADSTALETLIAWKQDQYRETKQPLLFNIRWVRELIDRLHTSRDPELRGQLSSLYFGDKLVAAHFGLRSRNVIHYWFPGYEASVSELSPGNILLRQMAEAAAAEGCEAIHLGAGDYRYKHEFADTSFPVTDGVVLARSLMGRTAAAAGRAFELAARKLPKPLSELPGKALRRIDWHLAYRVA